VALPRTKTLAALAALGAALLAIRPREAREALTLHAFELVAPRGVGLTSFDAFRDRRESLVLRVPGRVALRARIPERASLDYAWSAEPGTRVAIRVSAVAHGTPALEARVERAAGRSWTEASLDLAALAGRDAEIRFDFAAGAPRVVLARPELWGAAAGPARPNVLIYLVDCLRADHVGAYGYPRPTTPAIDQLARDGVVFETAQACASWTKPAVGCLFTGLYPVFHGARTVDDALDPGAPTLAEAFRAAGYATAAWIANPFVSAPAFGLTRGFHRVVQAVDKPAAVNINDLPADAALITRRVLPWLAANGDRRFFAFLHSLDLHAQYRRRPPFDRVFLSRDRKRDARQVDLYDNELAANDHEIGLLLGALKRLRLYDRTLIVVTADHGEEFGEHGFTRHGHTLHQGLLHVPLVLKLPRSAQAGRRVAPVVSAVDLAPTLLELAGLPPAQGLQGESLVPLLEGRTLAERAVFAEQLSPRESLYAGRRGRFKYVQQFLPEPGEALHDLAGDPGETRNIVADAPAEGRALADEVRRFAQLGQWGYHLALTLPRPEAKVRLRVEAERGVLADVVRFGIAAGESLALSGDRRRLDYRFAAGTRRRHVVLRADPPEAPLRLRLTIDGREAVIQAAPSGAELHSPVLLRAGALRAELAQVSGILGAGASAIRAFYVPPPAASRKAVLDPELKESLRALGYVQ
jgi:arylsulfatase A-like enzyme